MENYIYNNIENFYMKTNAIDKIYPILIGKSKISLRVIDWFVSNFCKKNNILYRFNDKYINIYASYKHALKSYSKNYFDPFCRNTRMVIKINSYEFETNLGQLNFFMWAYKYDIITYIDNNYETIVNDMNDTINYRKHSSDKHIDGKKKHSLSPSVYNKINRQDIDMSISL